MRNQLGKAAIFFTATVIVTILTSSFFAIRETDINIQSYTGNAGQITKDVLVGQTFVSAHDNLSAISIVFANYSNRPNTKDVVFHLRSDTRSSEDIRTQVVNASLLRDNHQYRFNFEPIKNSAGQSFFFFVVSPDSIDGNAITVDIDKRDPYHLGSAYIVRGEGQNITDPSALDRSGKISADVVFATHHSVRLPIAAINYTKKNLISFVNNWPENSGRYIETLKLATPALVIIFIMFALQKPKNHVRLGLLLTKKGTSLYLTILFGLAVLWRLYYAKDLPVTNDEGNYLYDARTLLENKLAGGDGYVKAPLVIIWTALWQSLLGSTVIAGRMASIIASSATIIPLYFLGKSALSRRAGLAAATLWALLGVTAVFGIYVHTQPVAIFFGVTGVALVWRAVRYSTLARLKILGVLISANQLMLFFSGILFGLGVASRKSILALGLLPLLIILLESKGNKQRASRLIIVGSGFLLVIFLLLGAAYLMYGQEGIWEVTGINSAEDSITGDDSVSADEVLAYSLRGMTPFFRESLFLIFVSLLGWGILLEKAARSAFRRQQLSQKSFLISSNLLPKLVWFAPLTTLWWAARFFFEYEGVPYLTMAGSNWLWYIFAGTIIIIALLPSGKKKVALASTSSQIIKKAPTNIVKKRLSRNITSLLIAPVWLIGLTLFYINWIKFHANYIGEFLPPLTLMAGVGLYAWWGVVKNSLNSIIWWSSFKRSILVGVTLVMFWAALHGNIITFNHPHTGTFELGSIKEAAVWAQNNIPNEESIFTGAAVVPYLSGHHTALDIAHPRWYAYEFTRKNTKRLNAFLPPIDEMLKAYREAEWFLLDKQTGFSFLMEYSEIEAGLEHDWEIVHEVENGSNTLKFLRRH